MEANVITKALRIGGTLRDFLASDLDVVFCGINPALSEARSGHHFSNPTNRFWRVLHLADFTPHLIQTSDDRTILQFACGLTAAVQRPTTRASEVTKDEFQREAKALERTIQRYRPRYLAFLGRPAFSAIFSQRDVAWGQQPIVFAGARVWVLPSPSGLNRAFGLQALVAAYQELRNASILDSHD